jgi:uncharacterized membrane protein
MAADWVEDRARSDAMISELQSLLTFIAALGTGLIAGTFFAFSAFVMRALERLPVECGVAAMQSINIVVIHPLFLSVFLGTGLVCAVLFVGALFAWNESRSISLITGSLAYLLGCLMVTMTRNVPMNKALAGIAAEGPEAVRYWPEYVSRWTLWNHLRTAASLAAMACFIAALSS